jgi:hypothetical protein
MVAAVHFFLTTGAGAFEMQDDQTAGSMANDARKRNNYWHRLDLGVFDGRVKTSPPDSFRYDRRLELMANIGVDRFLTQRIGARLNVKGEYTRKRLSDDTDPPTIIDHNRMRYHPSLDFTFVTDKGLELFGGAVAEMEPANEMVSETVNGESTTKYGSSTLIARRFGVVRRAGAWSGGFYYQLDTEGKRAVEQTAFDGTSLSTEEDLFLPSRMGIFGAFSAWSALWDFELGFIQARGAGPRDDTGNTAFTDYFEAKLAGIYPLGSGLGLKFGASHKTQSYANSAYINLDTIPATAIRALMIIGSAESHNFIGVIYGFGSDGQSLPEFNSTYEYKAAALTTGLFIPL